MNAAGQPELLPIAAALAVMLACTALGAAAWGGRGRLPGADTVVGAGLGGGLLTLAAVASRAPVSLWAGLLGIIALAALAWSAWRRRLPGGAGFYAALLLASPLLAFAALGPATMSDDFAQWLRNAAYVFQYDSLPRLDLPPTPSRHPGYPHILPFIMTSASWLAGRLLETAGPVANAVFLAAAGTAIADAAAQTGRHGWPARLATSAAAIGAFPLLFYPELMRNVLLSSYADTATIAAVGVLGLFGVALLGRADASQDADTAALAWRFGLAAAALVNLKQANLVLLALLLLGLLLAGWRSGRLGWAQLLRWSLPMLLPAALVYLVWRYYLAHNLPTGEMAFRSLAQWNWGDAPFMAGSLGRELATNPLFHLLMWGVSLAGLWKLRAPRHPEELLAVATAVVWLGYNAFLILVYLGAMEHWETQIAADYWRYTPHAGMLGVAAALLWLSRLSWPAALRRPALLLGLAALLPLSTLAAGPQRLSALGKPWPMQFRVVGRELAEILPPNARLAVTVGFDFYLTYSAIDYDLHRFGRDDRGLRYLDEPAITPVTFLSSAATHLLVMDYLGHRDEVTTPLGIAPVRGESALFEWTGAGFRKVHAWPFPQPAESK